MNSFQREKGPLYTEDGRCLLSIRDLSDGPLTVKCKICQSEIFSSHQLNIAFLQLDFPSNSLPFLSGVLGDNGCGP